MFQHKLRVIWSLQLLRQKNGLLHPFQASAPGILRHIGRRHFFCFLQPVPGGDVLDRIRFDPPRGTDPTHGCGEKHTARGTGP
jgi:hypothetical protein